MSELFGTDGPIYRVAAVITDILILSILWFLSSLPLFTIGASTSALYYVMTKRIADREGYLFRDFWKSFKENFKQATFIWLLLLLLFYIVYLNIANIDIVGKNSAFFLPFQYGFLAEFVIMTIFVFPIIARFRMKFKFLLRAMFFMANRHIVTSVLCILAAVALYIAFAYVPIVILIIPGAYAYITSYLFIRVFRKYKPKMDEDEEPEAENA